MEDGEPGGGGHGEGWGGERQARVTISTVSDSEPMSLPGTL